jgi:hypothetical protein
MTAIPVAERAQKGGRKQHVTIEEDEDLAFGVL